MAQWCCIHIVFILCIINVCLSKTGSDGDSSSGFCSPNKSVDEKSDLQLSWNQNIESGRVCECNVTNTHCMNVSSPTKSLKKNITKCFHYDPFEYPGMHPNCFVIYLHLDNNTCTREMAIRFRGDLIQGDNVTITGAKGSNVSVQCKQLHRSAVGWSKYCNILETSLQQNTSIICSHGVNGKDEVPSEALICQKETSISVTNIYIGVKRQAQSQCQTPGGQRTSGLADACCQFEQDDVLFNAHCLKQLQNSTVKEKYEDFIRSVYSCNEQEECKVNDTVLPLGPMNSSITFRRYSSYFIVEYECISNQTTRMTETTVSQASLNSESTTPEQERVSTNVRKRGNEKKGRESTDPLPTFVIPAVAAFVGVAMTAFIVAAAIVCIRKRRAKRTPPLYMTVEGPGDHELQTITTRNGQTGVCREDGFEDIPLESDNELDHLYDQADQQRFVKGSQYTAGEGEDDTYDHAGGRSGGTPAKKADPVKGDVCGKLNQDDVYDHTKGGAWTSSNKTESGSNTYGRLNMATGEDDDVYDHTNMKEKKIKVIDEQYSALNDV